MDYQFTLRTIYPYIGELPEAIWNTMLLSLLAIFLSMAIGAPAAIFKMSRYRIVRLPATVYVEVLRNVPLLVVLYIVFFIAPGLGVRLNSFTSALIALTINSGAYMTEIIRGGLLAVPNGQFETALSQGMTRLQMFRHIILPQVFRTIYAPLGNQFIQVILGSSLASAVSYNELTSWMQNTGASSYRFFESFAVAAVIYLILCQVVNVARVLTGRILFKGGH